ncbi:MAG: S9 family peptidase, partial [Marinilabiliales bacterium]
MRLNHSLITYVLACMLFSMAAAVSGQNEPVSTANYRLAERFSPTKLQRMVFSTRVTPNWLKTGDKFWYNYKTSQGTFYYLVDLERQSRDHLFDNHEMARQLTLITKDPYDHQNLPDIDPEFVRDDRYFRFKVTSTMMVDVEEEKEKEKEEELDKEEKDEEEELQEEEKDEEEEKEEEQRTAARTAPRREPKVFHLEYNIATGELYEIEEEDEVEHKSWASVSPDSSYVVFSRNFDLYWMDKENYLKARKCEDDTTIVEHRLTSEGEQYYAFGGGYSVNMNDDEEKIKKEQKKRYRANIVWSPDSRRFTVIRNDTREIKFLWVINSMSNPRPELESYKYLMPGEEQPAESELWVFDMESQEADTIPVAAFRNQTLSVPRMPRSHKESLEEHTPAIWLSTSSDELYFTRISRDLKRYDVCRVNLETMEVEVLIEERMNTYVDTRPPYLIRNTGEIIQWSERDGWAHFYLYGEDGEEKFQITTGPWHADRIIKVDERSRVMYFTAQGREAGENPYYTHLYSINLDGTGLRLLNPGNYDHQSFMSDSFNYFVNNYSRVDAAPRSEIRNSRGELVMELEEADLSNLLSAGYKFPEPFTVKAADGITDLYGVMYKPFDFDPEKYYPLIMYVYPGPQTEAVNTSFSHRMDRTDRLAQLGFIVVTVGNRGGHPNRSKWYHNYGYGDLRDYGLADKKYCAEQLADRHSFINIDQVGIFGHSGGGFMSTAAMLQYPDFFKVAVSSAGNHENNIYNRWWSEKHHGVKEIINNEGEVKFVYDIETNSELAKNLRGKLLLTTGDMDNNVHPANTYRMADALIRAKKRFDMFIMTGQRHGYGAHSEYNFWLTADYFAKHLIGDYSISTDIFEMRREHKLTPSDKRS